MSQPCQRKAISLPQHANTSPGRRRPAAHPVTAGLARLAGRAYARLLAQSPLEHLPLVGGPADGLVLQTPRPAPPWVYAGHLPAPLLGPPSGPAVASDDLGVYVATPGVEVGASAYQRVGPRYLHVP